MSQLRQVLPLELSGAWHFTKPCSAYGTLSFILPWQKYIPCRGFCRLLFCVIAAISLISWVVWGKYFTQNTDYLGLNTKLAAMAGPGAAALCVVTPTPVNTQCVLWPLCSLPATTSTEKLVVGGGSKALATVGCRPGGRADLSVWSLWFITLWWSCDCWCCSLWSCW